MNQPRQQEFWRGARDTFAMMVAAAPFAVIFGTLAGSAGLSLAQAQAMSLVMYAGSAQFIAVSLFASGTGLAVMWLTTLVVNLRHLLYAATLLPHVRHLPQRWLVPMGFWLTDETFAVVNHRYSEAGSREFAHWYYVGAALPFYLNWNAWTLLGLTIGQLFPGLAKMGLDFAMSVTFIGIVVPSLRNRPMLAASLSAGLVALLAHAWPYKLGLMAAAAAGVAVGLLLEKRQ